MTSKEAFEKWYSAFFFTSDGTFGITRLEDAGFYYTSAQVDEYWKGWQASRAATLEEAAQFVGSKRWQDEYHAGEIADAIEDGLRRLARDGSSEGEKA